MTWGDGISSKQTDSIYEASLNKFTFLYETFVVTVKPKTLKNPWITKGTLQSLKESKGYMINC